MVLYIFRPQGTGYIRQLLEKCKRRGEQIKPETFIVSDNGEKTEPKALKRALKLAIQRSVGRHPTGEPFRISGPMGYASTLGAKLEV